MNKTDTDPKHNPSAPPVEETADTEKPQEAPADPPPPEPAATQEAVADREAESAEAPQEEPEEDAGKPASVADEDTTMSADVAPDKQPPPPSTTFAMLGARRTTRPPLKPRRNALCIRQDGGTLTMSDRVIATIVRTEGMVEGVREIGGHGLAKKLQKLLARGRMVDGVYIETMADGLRLEVTVSVDYGTSIPEIADRLRRNISERIEYMTGFAVRAVSIVVDRIIMQQHRRPGSSPGATA